MKQEFVTLYGKAIIEGDKLYFRRLRLPLGETALAQIGYELTLPALFIATLLNPDGSLKHFDSIVIAGLMLSNISRTYDRLFKRSYASRIALSAIKSVTIKDDYHGLETEVRLHLSNGRYKKVLFRKLEHQYEAFLEVLSRQQISAVPA